MIEGRKVTFVATIYLNKEWDEGYPNEADFTDAKLIEDLELILTHEHSGVAGYKQAKVTLIPEFENPYPES